MKIKLIIETCTKKRDVSGNRYSKVIVTNTANSKSVKIDTGWGNGSNVRFNIRRDFGFDGSQMYCVDIDDLRNDQYSRIETDCNEHTMIKALRKIGVRKQAVKS